MLAIFKADVRDHAPRITRHAIGDAVDAGADAPGGTGISARTYSTIFQYESLRITLPSRNV